jgi:hypothetical protein
LPAGLVTITFALAVLFGLATPNVSGVPPAFAASGAQKAQFKFFYTSLKPHGRWVRHPRYDWIWKPRVSRGWRPYTVGRWRHSKKYGWLWDSSEPYGAIVFHYGWWDRDAQGDWFWAPGYVWSPAWVVWKKGSTHAGWAPVPPDRYWGRRVSVEISVSWEPRYEPPPTYWAFVEFRHITAPSLTQVVVAPQNNVIYIDKSKTIHNTTIVNQTIVNQGLDPRALERDHKVKVEDTEPAVVRQSERPSPDEAGGTAPAAVSGVEIVQPFGATVAEDEVVTGAEAEGVIPSAEIAAAPVVEEAPREAAATAPESDPATMAGDPAAAPKEDEAPPAGDSTAATGDPAAPVENEAAAETAPPAEDGSAAAAEPEGDPAAAEEPAAADAEPAAEAAPPDEIGSAEAAAESYEAAAPEASDPPPADVPEPEQ